MAIEGFYPILGYQINEAQKGDANQQADIAFKVAAYFPVIGTIIGICRVVAYVKNDQQYASYKVFQIARGLIESLSLGVFLVVPDLVATAILSYQQFKNKQVPVQFVQ